MNIYDKNGTEFKGLGYVVYPVFEMRWDGLDGVWVKCFNCFTVYKKNEVVASFNRVRPLLKWLLNRADCRFTAKYEDGLDTSAIERDMDKITALVRRYCPEMFEES